MARVLVLDDSKERLRAFRRKLIGHEVITTTTTSEAIHALESIDFEIAYFDHDLGGKILVSSGPETGYEVAKWLESNPERKPKTMYIHSFNPAGAQT